MDFVFRYYFLIVGNYGAPGVVQEYRGAAGTEPEAVGGREGVKRGEGEGGEEGERRGGEGDTPTAGQCNEVRQECYT